uniref:Cyclic nucleotide-binding domain-containing protein n=1 Tax=Glossina palpalis gambiensis TaxID=67801 RepID=A0A1B0BH15_9MUSC
MNVKKNINMLLGTRRKIGLLIIAKVRARLCEVIKFMVIGPGCTLIREGDPPSVVWFILTGEVEVRKKFYDHIVGKWVNRIQILIGPGECVGDVELIDGCLRTQTLTTTG